MIVYGQEKRAFTWAPTLEIPSGQDLPFLPAQVANQNTGFPSSSHALAKSAMYIFTRPIHIWVTLAARGLLVHERWEAYKMLTFIKLLFHDFK